MIDPLFNLDQEDKISALLEENVGREQFRPGLERLRGPFSFFQKYLDTSSPKVITVSGTNGKGETCMRLKEILSEQGFTSTLWSSPHILSIRERFALKSGPVSYTKLLEVIEQALKDLPQGSMSYYELVFYCFCKLTVKENPDVVIFEVGLGGRFDAVNLFDASICALTSISRDHEEILGPGLSNILNEKLGIARNGVPFLYSLEQSKLRDQAKKVLVEYGAQGKDLLEESIINFEMNYSTRNQILAHEIYRTLFNTQLPFKKDLKKFKGRFEEVTSENIRFIFIGAHNLDGVKKTRDLLLQNPNSNSDFLCSFSKRSEQDIKSCMKVFLKAPCLYENLYFTGFKHFKSDSTLVKECALEMIEGYPKARWTDEWKEYLVEKYKSKDTKKIITVMGSYYFIGEVQRFIISLNK